MICISPASLARMPVLVMLGVTDKDATDNMSSAQTMIDENEASIVLARSGFAEIVPD